MPAKSLQSWFFATLWTVAHQSPLSLGFPRQEHWSGLPFPSPGHLPDPGIEPTSLKSPALVGRFFTTSATREAQTIPVTQTWSCSEAPVILFRSCRVLPATSATSYQLILMDGHAPQARTSATNNDRGGNWEGGALGLLWDFATLTQTWLIKILFIFSFFFLRKSVGKKVWFLS